MAGQTEDGSWGKVVGITVAACLVVGALLWLIVPKGAPVNDSASAIQSDGDDRASSAAQRVERSLTGRDHRSKAERLESRLGKPPKLSVQVSDPLVGTCPEAYSESIVVRVIRGGFDRVVAEVRIPKDKVTRTRTLMLSEGDWTGTIGGLPVNRTAKLYIIASGPRGQDTVYKDITHNCPGDPVDRDDPNDLLGNDARRAIREKMFANDFDFDFDMAGADKKK